MVLTEGPVAHPDGTVNFKDLANDRILKLGTDGLVTTYRQPANRPNDLTFDARWRIHFTGPGEVYRLDTDGVVTKIAASPLVQGSNGLTLSLDDRTLYLVEINRGAGLPRQIRAFDLSPEGSLSNPRSFHDFAPGRGGDGMGIDVEGNVDVAAGMNQTRDTSETLDNPAGVYVFSPAGQLINRIPIPQDTITNLAFGGPDMQTMYVMAGNTVFRVAMDIAGTHR